MYLHARGAGIGGGMSDDDISRAFAHPLERARASQGPGPVPDRISLRDHVVSVEIGAFAAERGVSQRLAFNVVVEVAPPAGPVADDVDKILSYDRVTEAIAAELAARRFDLLETLAEGIAARILRAPQALRVFVRIEKLDRGPGALGVEIVRTGRPAVRAEATQGGVPLLVYLPAGAAQDARLAGFLDRLAALDLPLLLLSGQPDTLGPAAATQEVARRIALLGADQTAWALSGADARLSVAASRTEIDWALARRQLAIWAPARLILAAASPPAMVGDGLARALWLAGELGSSTLLLVGTKPPSDRSIPAEIRLLEADLDARVLPKLR